VTTWASPEDVQSAADRWTDGQVDCRIYGHSWRSLSAIRHPGAITVYQRCSRCTSMRHQDINERGYPLSRWHIGYSDGYLLRNMGRVGQDGRAVLRLASLRSLTFVEQESVDA